MSTRAAVRDERAPLLVSEADAALGREAKDAGRRLPAVLACVAVGFLVALVSLSVTVASERGSDGVARVGWKLDDAAAEEAETQYGEVPEGGVTKAEYEAARAADADVQKASEKKAEKGSEAAAALGWVPDETFMKEAERLYNEVPVGGVTQRDYEAGYTKEEDAAMHASFAEPSSEGDEERRREQEQQSAEQEQHSAEQRRDGEKTDDREDYDAPSTTAPGSSDHANQPNQPMGISQQLDMGATGQPRERLRSPNADRAKTLSFNPCADLAAQEAQWNTRNLDTQCVVDASRCNFCAWVLQYDSEYRVNDVVSLLGPNYKVTSQSLLTRPEYQGTILRDMLEAKPKNGGDRIAWKQNAREEAQDNFDFVKNRVRDMQCRSTPSDTLLVHLRAGDAVGAEYKEIPDVDASAQRVVQYAKERPGIKRIEISGVLHFGVPDPNDAFYQSNGGFEVVKDDSGEPRYRVTDAILQKNGYIVNRFIREGRDAGLEVWFTSNNNPDTDMCRFAKACHFLSASRVIGKPALGDAQSRVSFSDLLDDLHWNLRNCN